MFKKKPHVKALAPIRSSDRRKLADEIIRDYGLSVKIVDDATDEQKAAATAQHTQLRNSLLPDNVQAARFSTTHGPELKQISGTLYVGSHASGQEARAMWFSLEGRLYPTVYSLWQNPGLVPLLHTPEAVVDKLKGGANLMTPGLAGPPFPPHAVTGAMVAIASLNSPSVPVAVGTCAIDIASLTSTAGAKGHAVEVMHWVGDEVWSYSTTAKPGRQPPEQLEGWQTRNDAVEELVSGTAELSVGIEAAGGVPLPNHSNAAEAAPVDGTPDDAQRELEGPPLTTKQIDEAFRRAFSFGVYQHVTANAHQQNYGLDFPLNQSFVMSTLIQPFLPIFTAQDTKQLQIKNSSFKGLKKFLKSLDKERLIKAKEKPSETLVMDIDFTDPAIADFKPYRLPKKESSTGRGGTASQPTSPDDPSIGQVLALQTLYKIPEKLGPLFDTQGSEQYLPAADVKAAMSAYIDHQQLTSPTNKRLAKLDPFLSNTLFTGNSGLDSQVRAQGTCTRDALADRAVAACAVYWTLSRKPADGGPRTTSKPRAGSGPRVRVTLETRAGNKTATKISGFESFGVLPGPLAEELRRACAGSASVESLVGASPKDGLSEVMVQGPQRDAVLRALERRGVREKWVEVVDKTKKK